MTRIPDFDDVRAAARRLEGHARRTPLLADTPLDTLTGGRILLKLETLQHTGSFKFRGAWNRLAQLSATERAAGVVAFSSGNHAQGVAEAARRLGIRATIVMPADAPRMKLQNTRDLGAEVVRLRSENPVQALLEFGRARGVRHIVVGRSHKPWWRRLLGQSPVYKLVTQAAGFDLHIVSLEDRESLE